MLIFLVNVAKLIKLFLKKNFFFPKWGINLLYQTETKTKKLKAMTTEIKVQNSTIIAYTTIDESWNNAIPNGFWGTGYVLVKDNLYITLSENHELFEYLIDTLNWKLI